MIVQIYTTQTPEEGLALAAAGVDYIGITPSTAGLPGEVSNEKAAEVFRAIGDKAVKVALSIDADLQRIVKMVSIVKPDILHLCGDITVMTPQRVAELRKLIPGMKIMQAVPMTDEKSLKIAEQYQDVAEYLILDSVSKDIDGIGAAGFTHDWCLSREIVQKSHLPVILAGGLTVENVADAIRFVRPWGVDSLTHTNLPLGGGKFRKDIERVQKFVAAAKEAGKESGSER